MNISVVNIDSLGADEIHTQTPGSCAKQEKLACVWAGAIVEMVHLRPPILL